MPLGLISLNVLEDALDRENEQIVAKLEEQDSAFMFQDHASVARIQVELETMYRRRDEIARSIELFRQDSAA